MRRITRKSIEFPRSIILDSDEVTRAISVPMAAIVETIRIALEQAPPELAADIVDKGIVLTGGVSLLRRVLSC